MSPTWSPLPLTTTSVLTITVPLLSLLWWLSTRRKPNLPPGPGPALPILGHLHLMEKDPRQKFQEWKRRYGDVFSLYLGSKLVVVLASYSAIHEGLVKFADVFSERPHIFVMDRISEGKGIAGSSGPLWKEQRKLSLETLRRLGMGKNVLAQKIQEEITHFTQAIADFHGAPVDLARMTQVTVSNNICSIVMGKRFDYDNPDFNAYLSSVDHNMKLFEGTSFLNFLPVLEHIPGDLFKIKRVLANIKMVEDFFHSFIQPHMQKKEEEDEEKECPDYISAYARQIHEVKDKTTSTINVDNLLKCVGDLFVAGTETTSTALRWTLLFFLHYPEVQDKCYKEICDFIGTQRLPTMQDKQALVYLEATIWEVLRKGDIAPMAVQHGVAHETTLRGYVIPQDAIVIPLLSNLLHDPEIWGDPENFWPERFIGPDGKLTRPDEFIPFGIGRRVCLGESLARMELFLYLANLIQRFHFLPADKDQLPPLAGVVGITHTPQNYQLRAVPRL